MKKNYINKNYINKNYMNKIDMNKIHMNKSAAIVLAAMMTVSLAACGGGQSTTTTAADTTAATEAQTTAMDTTAEATEAESTTAEATVAESGAANPTETGTLLDPAEGVDLIQKLNALRASTDDLGLTDKYETLDAIEGAKIDPAIIGTWSTADGRIAYTFNEEGTVKTAYETFESTTDFTCLDVDGRHIAAEKAIIEEESVDNMKQSPVVYMVYEIDNDVLYIEYAEDPDPNSTNYIAQLLALYRADESGSIEASISKNHIALAPFYGTWVCDQGEVTLDEKGLTMDDETYNAQFNDKHQLVVEKDGDATTYTFAFSYMRYGKVSENPEETIGIALSYTGADGNDKPNLAKLLTDWHEEYGYEEWLYNGSFTKK